MNIEVLMAFIIYFALVLGVGFYFYKRSSNMEDYILGGRSMNPYVTALSAQASDMSSWLLMGLPGAVLLMGLGEAWIGIGLAAGSYLSWLFVAKRLRKHSVVSGNSLTVPEFFSNRYKDKKGYLRFICGLIILFFFVIYVASGFKGCGVTLQTIFPELSVELAMCIGGVIIIAYTFLGGYKAVCWTDFFQGLLMLVAVVVVPLAAINALGGWSDLEAGWAEVGVEQFTNLFWDNGSALGFIAILSLLAWAFGYFGMPHIVVRYMSIRDPEEVKVSRRVSLVWIVIALSAAILVGMVGRVYVGEAEVMSADFNAEHIFLRLAGDLFAPIIAGLFFAAVMAAIMSTADSQLLVASSSITNDVLGKYEKYNDPRKLMWISRFVVVVVAVLALVLALFGGNNIMGLVSYAWAGFGAAFGPLMLLSLYWKRMNLQGAIASVFTGFLTVILWNTFLTASTGVYELLPGFIFAAIAGVLVSLATPAPSEEIQREFDEAQSYVEQR
ncbi:MAG: sodium/proline symporter PutP [Candidatus Methanomethylophilaceae archaeon]|nr:sodium/proline symporter PutP [Candidatus Methanomethylophilaceae archaeon]